MRILSAEPYLNTLPDDVFERVTRSLSRTAHGFSRDLVTPLIPDREHPKEGRLQRIEEISSWLYPTGYEWLDQLEEDNQARIGPYSIQLPYVDRKEQVYSYFADRQLDINKDAWDYSIEATTRLVTSRLHSTSAENAWLAMPHSTNLGAPFYSADQKYRRSVLDMARFIIENRFREDFLQPCLIYWRGQPRGIDDDPKQRTIWGYSHIYTVLELMLQIPMLNYLRKKIEFAAWVGPSAVDQAVTTIIDYSEVDILSVDFSGFDASIPEVLIEVVFNIMRSWFSSRDHRLIDYVERVFLEVPLLTPEGLLYQRDGGVPSGSGVTNLIDSLVQLFALNYIAYRLGNRVAIHLVQGDDGVCMFVGQWQLRDVTDVANELGLKISSDKGGVSPDQVYYLQNVHSRKYRKNGQCVGVRPVMKAYNGMFSYEHFVHDDWSGELDTIRWWQQLEQLHWHPAFDKSVAFLYEHDRYSQGYSIEKLIHDAGGKEAVLSALDLESFPFGKVPIDELPKSHVAREVLKLRRSGLKLS